MIIRKALPSDAHAIAKVHIASWQEIYKGLLSNELLDNLSVAEREKLWKEGLESGWNVFVAVDDSDKILGLVSYCPSRDEDADSKLTAEVAAIYLHPKIWRKGIGRLLCEKIFDEAKLAGFHDMMLWVIEKNHQARHFYERLGFKLIAGSKLEDMEGEFLEEVRYRKILK